MFQMNFCLFVLTLNLCNYVSKHRIIECEGIFYGLVIWAAAVVLCIVIVLHWNQAAQSEWLIVDCLNTSLI